MTMQMVGISVLRWCMEIYSHHWLLRGVFSRDESPDNLKNKFDIKQGEHLSQPSDPADLTSLYSPLNGIMCSLNSHAEALTPSV